MSVLSTAVDRGSRRVVKLCRLRPCVKHWATLQSPWHRGLWTAFWAPAKDNQVAWSEAFKISHLRRLFIRKVMNVLIGRTALCPFCHRSKVIHQLCIAYLLDFKMCNKLTIIANIEVCSVIRFLNAEKVQRIKIYIQIIEVCLLAEGRISQMKNS